MYYVSNIIRIRSSSPRLSSDDDCLIRRTRINQNDNIARKSSELLDECARRGGGNTRKRKSTKYERVCGEYIIIIYGINANIYIVKQ